MKPQNRTVTLNGIVHNEQALKLLVKAYSSEIAVAGWEKKLFGFIGEWISDEPVIEIQTSGSTGKPGKLVVEKEKMVESALRTGEYLDLKKNDRALLALPVSFIAGKMMVVRSFVLGLDLIPVYPSSNPLVTLEQSIDFAALTPMQLYYALSNENGTNAVNSIEKLIIGGGEVSLDLLNRIKHLKTAVWHTYGMAETLTHVAMKKLNGQDSTDHFRALPGVSFGKDERGCLEIYAKWLSKDKIVTNDLVELLDNTQFDFIGRYDNMINSGGIKISPETVEAKLATQIKARFIVLGLPDEALGEKLVLVIESKQTTDESYWPEIDSVGLSSYEKPREIRFLYQFPVTESGKVIRTMVLQHLLNK